MNNTLCLQKLTDLFSGQVICLQEYSQLSAMFESVGFTLVDCLSSDSLYSTYFTVGIDNQPGMVRFLYNDNTHELIPQEVITIPEYDDLDDPDDFHRHFIAQSFVWGIRPLQDNRSGHMLADGKVVLIGSTGDDCLNWYCANVNDTSVDRVITLPHSLLLHYPQHIFDIAIAVTLR